MKTTFNFSSSLFIHTLYSFSRFIHLIISIHYKIRSLKTFNLLTSSIHSQTTFNNEIHSFTMHIYSLTNISEFICDIKLIIKIHIHHHIHKIWGLTEFMHMKKNSITKFIYSSNFHSRDSLTVKIHSFSKLIFFLLNV